jgi:hypothetical protein
VFLYVSAITGHHHKAFIHSSMAVRPFTWSWPINQYRNLFYTDGRTPWTGDQPISRLLPTHRTTQTQNKRTQTSMRRDPSV